MRPLVSAAELAGRLLDVTLLDVRWQLGRDDGHEQYLAGHLPGAMYVDLETDLAAPPHTGTGGRHPLPEAASFQEGMRRVGVSAGRTVVVYDAVGGISAARAWWLLGYFGHPAVEVLDGGLQAWEGLIETGEVVSPAGDFVAEPGHRPVLTADDALALVARGVLVDARAPERFRGEVEPVDPVAGHIPGAINVPTSATLDQGHLLATEALRELYPAGEEYGVYCGSGVTAAHGVLALECLGIEAALYPGSWSHWVSDPERPVATGP